MRLCRRLGNQTPTVLFPFHHQIRANSIPALVRVDLISWLNGTGPFKKAATEQQNSRTAEQQSSRAATTAAVAALPH
ncbi:hypothetical protein M0802_005579 [Mischocyttarus mexicanus]|nr:hypothetical protein M0802_005579 [Mischocyttarus mexicanus]